MVIVNDPGSGLVFHIAARRQIVDIRVFEAHFKKKFSFAKKKLAKKTRAESM